MSKVQEFLQKAAEDKALQEKVAAIMKGQPEEISDKIVTLAKENGFEITFDEVLKEVKGQEGEVSDDELDKVVGGGYWDFNNPEEVARLLKLQAEEKEKMEQLMAKQIEIQRKLAKGEPVDPSEIAQLSTGSGTRTEIEEGNALLQAIARGR